MAEEMSQDLKQYLRQKGKLCLQEGVLYWHGNQARCHENKLQLVVPQECKLEAMCGAHNDIGHLGLKWMLDILRDQFYWPNLDANHCIHNCEQCLKFKIRQDKEEFYPLLATHPLELVHMDFLMIEYPHTGTDVNILVIIDHFTQYPKTMVTSSQTAKATATAFWNGFITNFGFLEKLLTDHCCAS